MSHYFENDNSLESNIKNFDILINDIKFTFSTDNGVFSKGELDFGTYLLIKNVLKMNLSGNILDLGCGYGPVGIILTKIFDVNTDMVEYENINNKYNFIISNPPIRIGKKNLYELLIDSGKHLEKDGEILIVVRKEQGALSLIKDMSVYYNVKTIDKDKGFLIISLKND